MNIEDAKKLKANDVLFYKDKYHSCIIVVDYDDPISIPNEKQDFIYIRGYDDSDHECNVNNLIYLGTLNTIPGVLKNHKQFPQRDFKSHILYDEITPEILESKGDYNERN